MSGELLVAAFFDSPNLLAVRFEQSGAAARVARFATTRRPDAVPGGCAAIGATILVGVAVVGIGFGVVKGCSSDRPLPVISEAVAMDCDRSPAWAGTLATLGDDLAPREMLKPWHVRTLLDVPRELARRGDATGGWLKPRCSLADMAAHRQGRMLGLMLADAGALADAAIILDLPGPQAVAAAAGMAAHAEPVFTMDNLPHPSGVVPAAQTLATLVHWRPHIVQARSGRKPDAPPLFVLEGERLNPYGNESDRFDNRSQARIPDAFAFRTLGVKRILHVRQRRGQVVEADDLNAVFAACGETGIEIRHIALDSLDTAAPAPAAERSDNGPHMWFWRNYGWGMPTGLALPMADDADAAYRSTARPMPQTSTGLLSQLDGGRRRSGEVMERLMRPAPSSSGGGSWSRSHTHSSG